MRAAVFGSKGFIGARLADRLERKGWAVRRIGRGDDAWRGQDLGHVFFCIGLTADFRERPLDAMEAHVSAAVDVLRHARFESFLYLSTTRLYAGAEAGVETARFTVDPTDSSDLYNLSKLAGEAAVLALARPETRIARLSNVFGPGMDEGNFLGSIIASARTGRVRLRQGLASAKDYVAVDDVAEALEQIAVAGGAGVYNLASGANVAHGELLAELTRLTGCAVEVEPGARDVCFPPISVARLQALMPWRPASVVANLSEMIAAQMHKEGLQTPNV